MRIKFILGLILVAGLFSFQGAPSCEMPRESVRIELVVRTAEKKVSFHPKKRAHAEALPSTTIQVLSKAQVVRPILHALLISSQHRHSSL